MLPKNNHFISILRITLKFIYLYDMHGKEDKELQSKKARQQESLFIARTDIIK